MKRRYVISIVVGVMVVGMANVALARPRGMMRAPNEGRMDRVAEELQLTPEQEKEIDAINATYQSKMKTQGDRVRESHDALNDAIKSGADNRNITTKFDALHVEKKKLDRLRLDRSLDIRSILTPEQRKKFVTLKGKRFEDIRNQRSAREKSVGPRSVNVDSND